MAKNKEIKRFRITGRHKESPDRILSHAKKIVESNPKKDIRFMLSDQAGDNVNTAIKKSGYKFTVNPASKYDAKDLSRGAKLRTEAELKGGVIYSRLAEGGKIKGGYDKYYSDRYKHLQDTNPTNTYDKKTGKQIGTATADLRNPKNIILDEIYDELDEVKRQGGVDFIENKISSWESKQKANPSVKKSISFSEGSKKWAVWKGKEIKFNYTEPPEVYPWLNKDQQYRFDEIKGEVPSKVPHELAWREDLGVDPEVKKPKKLINRGTIFKHLGKGKFVEGRGKGYSKTASTEEFSKAEFTKPDEIKRYQKSIITETDYEKSTLHIDKGSYLEQDQAKYRKELKDLDKLPFIENRVRSESESISSFGKKKYKKALDSSEIKVPDMITTEQNKFYKTEKLKGKIKGIKPTKFIGGFVLGGIVSSLFSRSNLQAKGIKQPSSKQLAQQVAADFVGNQRVYGGVGEKKGWVQEVSLTKKGVDGKRRASGPIKGAGGDSTPYAAITRYFSPSKKNAFKNRARN
jgi:hypothetical protein